MWFMINAFPGHTQLLFSCLEYDSMSAINSAK